MYYTENEQVIVFTRDENVKKTFRLLRKNFPDSIHILTSAAMLEEYKLPNTIFIDCAFFTEKERTDRLVSLIKTKYSRVPIILLIDENSPSCAEEFLLHCLCSVVEKPIKRKIVETIIYSNLKRLREKDTERNYHGIFLNAEESSLYYNQCKLRLSKTEFYIMDILVSEKHPISENCLAQILKMELGIEMSESYVRVTISRLRTKIRRITDLNIIGTKKKDGYYIKI